MAWRAGDNHLHCIFEPDSVKALTSALGQVVKMLGTPDDCNNGLPTETVAEVATVARINTRVAGQTVSSFMRMQVLAAVGGNNELWFGAELLPFDWLCAAGLQSKGMIQAMHSPTVSASCPAHQGSYSSPQGDLGVDSTYFHVSAKSGTPPDSICVNSHSYLQLSEAAYAPQWRDRPLATTMPRMIDATGTDTLLHLCATAQTSAPPYPCAPQPLEKISLADFENLVQEEVRERDSSNSRQS